MGMDITDHLEKMERGDEVPPCVAHTRGNRNAPLLGGYGDNDSNYLEERKICGRE
jgi:hypothetical protein